MVKFYVPTWSIFAGPVTYVHYNCNTGSVDISIEAVSALSNAHQVNNCLVDDSILECFINDGASDDRAVKCCINNHCHWNSRRRFVAMEGTETNNQYAYVLILYWHF